MTVDGRLKDIMRRFEALDDIDRIEKLTTDDKLNFVISIIKACRQDGIEASAKITDAEVEKELAYSKDLGIRGTTTNGLMALKIGNNIRELLKEKA